MPLESDSSYSPDDVSEFALQGVKHDHGAHAKPVQFRGQALKFVLSSLGIRQSLQDGGPVEYFGATARIPHALLENAKPPAIGETFLVPLWRVTLRIIAVHPQADTPEWRVDCQQQ